MLRVRVTLVVRYTRYAIHVDSGTAFSNKTCIVLMTVIFICVSDMLSCN